MKLSKWFWIDSVLGIVTAVGGIVGIFTGIKAGNDQEKMLDARLEQKYGLTPKSEEETE